MAKKFIHCVRKNGAEYAYVYTPRKIDGKKHNDPEYLGLVIDKDNGVYRSRKRGLFAYSIENGYRDLDPNAYTDEMLVPEAGKEEKLILDFGDAYCLYTAMKTNGLHDIIMPLLPGHADTFMSLIGYKLLDGSAKRYASVWWEGSYTRILYPKAKLRSQRVSEFYQMLGDEAVQQSFFHNYLRMFCKGKRAGILIDSTGLPNNIKFPLTAANTHNGKTSKEARLLYVVDRISKMPLFFRYNAGNIVDVTTLRSTIVELEAFGIDIDYAIVDAGYYSEDNIKSLYGNEKDEKSIPFLIRLVPNRKLYKELIAEHAGELNQAQYMLMQRGRLMSVKRVKIVLHERPAYAYIALDHARREDEILKYAREALTSKEVTFSKMDAEMKTKGLFILISSECMETKEVMPLYYSRQTIEQIFDIGKNNADLLPLRVHSEEAFRGHLLLSFIVTVACLSFNQMLNDTAYNAHGAFMILRNQKCKVFDDRILPKEVNKKMNEIYSKLMITPPICIPNGGNN